MVVVIKPKVILEKRISNFIEKSVPVTMISDQCDNKKYDDTDEPFVSAAIVSPTSSDCSPCITLIANPLLAPTGPPSPLPVLSSNPIGPPSSQMKLTSKCLTGLSFATSASAKEAAIQHQTRHVFKQHQSANTSPESSTLASTYNSISPSKSQNPIIIPDFGKKRQFNQNKVIIPNCGSKRRKL